MAQIPGPEGFGEVVAQPQRLPVNLPSGAFGAQIGQSIERVGQIRAVEEQREADAQERLRVTADRAQAAHRIKMGEVELDQLAEQIGEDVRMGRLDKGEAAREWQARANEFASTAAGEAPSAFVGEVKSALQVRGAALAGRVRQGVAKKDQEDTRASLLGLMEGHERDAVVDRPGAIEKAAKTIATLGPAAGYGQDDQVRLMQSFRENSAYNVGERYLLRAGNNMKALDALQQRLGGEEFEDLSPEKRQTLEVRVEGRKQSVMHAQEVARNRAEALEAKHLRDAEHATKAVQTIVDGGAVPDDATVTAAVRASKGTPYEAALSTLISQSGQRAAFGSLTPDKQQEQLVQMRTTINQQGTSPAAMERLHSFETIAGKTRDLVDRDALQWGLQSRLLPEVQPLQFNSLEQLAGIVGSRVEQAQAVGAHLRRPVSPLFANEAERLGEMFAILPMEQKKSAIRTLARALPPEQQRALAGQMNAKDTSLALAMHAASLPPSAGPDPVDLILRGQDAVKAGRLKADDPVRTADRVRIAKDLNAVQWPTTKARDAAVNAAALVYDGLRDSKGSGNPTKAIEIATGGGLAEWGPVKVPVPPGWSESRFRSSMRSLKVEDITRQANGALFVGPAQIGPDALLLALPSATLIPVGPGEYAVDAGGLVLDQRRKPFILKPGS